MSLLPDPKNENFTKAKDENHEDLLDLIEQAAPFGDSSKVAQCMQNCLKLLKASNSSFNTCQLTVLIQVTAFALNNQVQLESVATQGDNTTLFETATHSLKVVYRYDEYDIYLTDKETGKTELNEGVYVDDFGSIMREIKEQSTLKLITDEINRQIEKLSPHQPFKVIIK
jgi:hypothetical protein